MTVRQPRYSKEEFARRGNELYERQIRAQVEAGNHGKIVAIDIETGAYEVAECTFRTLFRPSEAILEELPAETGGGAVYRLFHALQPIAATSFSP
jgi:hypothetical protein